MNKQEKIQAAKEIHEGAGGTLFAFPVDPEDPLSRYAVVAKITDRYEVYDEIMCMEEAAQCIAGALEMYREEGIDADYDDNVRFIMHDAQMNAPSTTMRRLKKNGGSSTTPQPLNDSDFIDNGDDTLITAKGVIRLSHYTMVSDNNKKAKRFMFAYYKLLSNRGYGKTAREIKREVSKKTIPQVNTWIENTYAKYVYDPMEIMDILNGLQISNSNH